MKISPMNPGLRWLWDHLPCLILHTKSNQMPSASFLHTCAPIHNPFKPFCYWNTNLARRLMALIRGNREYPNFSSYKSTVLLGTPVEKKYPLHAQTNISILSHHESNVFPAQPLSLWEGFYALSQFLSASQMTAVWSFTLLLNCSWVLCWFYSRHGWKAFIHWVR